jgi:t-SNARE complex subunit (syntaxin)
MSFEQSSNLEAGHGDGRYHDDPAFQQLVVELRNKLRVLERNTMKLKTDVSLLGTKRDTARMRERCHSMLEKCREDCMAIGEGVKKLQAFDDLTVRHHLPSAAMSATLTCLDTQKQQKYERNKLATDFQEAVRDFQDVQRSALEKQKASVSAARAAHEHEGEEATSPTRQQQVQEQQQQELLTLAAQGEVDFQEALIVEREEEIRNIEQGVGDLNVLFRQVAQIVSEQGNQLDTIADNVYVTRDETHGAMIETRQAARYQKAARNKSCFLLIILAIILTIVLLAVLT